MTYIKPQIARITLRLCVSVFIFTGCTKVEIHHREEVNPTGQVSIRPAGHDYQLPALAYHFYNTDTKKEYIVRSCDGLGNFEGTLPTGEYRVIATNLDALNVEFTDMESHELATVIAIRMDTRTGTLPARSGTLPVGEVYSTVISDLVVTGQEVLTYTPLPVLLTKRVRLSFTLQGELKTEVVGLSGVLPGVYPSVQLYTHTHSAECITQSVNTSIAFDTSVVGSQYQAQMNLFGLRNPEHGEGYTNTLVLHLDMADGTTMRATVDLTHVLSDIIDQNEGTIPLQLAIPIEVKKTPIGAEGIIMGWIDEGESEWIYD